MRPILYLDCFSGLAGDMIVAALLDLGVPWALLETTAKALPLDGYTLRTERTERNSIYATRFIVDVDEAAQPHRHYSDIRHMLEHAALPSDVRELALSIFAHIARAEARVHGTSTDHVHFHEVGAVDSIIDIVCAAAALRHLDAQVVCAPIPLGTGFVATQHGQLPVPAPATLLILEGIPVVGTDIRAELTTPTGAAIARATATRFGTLPAMTPTAIGFGAGARSLKAQPNVLRAILGTPTDATHTGPLALLEANIDDMSGEIAAFAAAQLRDAGALDVWFTPIQMKKDRPGVQLSVLCRQADADALSEILLAETTTIGVRQQAVTRTEMRRTHISVTTPHGDVRVKVATHHSGRQNVAPEFADCEALARRHGVPLKKIMALATAAAWQALDTPPAAQSAHHHHDHDHGHDHDPR